MSRAPGSAPWADPPPEGASSLSGRPGERLASGLALTDLRVEISAGGRRLAPVDGVSLAVGRGECLALLGESGCGKSLTALAVMRLLPEGLVIAAGDARLDGTDLFTLAERDMRAVRGGQLAMIFQEPMTSLNPVMTLGRQIGEALAAHHAAGQDAAARVAELLRAVGLEARHAAGYPYQLSGGQRQRALIATMLAGEPRILIADEPTTALDVTVQAQILALLDQLKQQRDMGLLLITHDLDVARDMADRVAIMYAGQIVEEAPRESLYAAPFHPYTRKLFSVLPSAARRGERLDHLPGSVPPLGTALAGCRFAARCPQAWGRCQEEAPGLHDLGAGHRVRCHLAVEPGSRREETRPAEAQALPSQEAGALLEVRNLAVRFPIRRGVLQRTVGWVQAVEDVSMTLGQGETVALVGESGCGKTTLARAVLRLIRPTAGSVRLAGEAVSTLEGEALRRRRRDMQIVFQDPFSSLNPRMRVGEILEEGLQALRPELPKAGRRQAIDTLLEQVGLDASAALRYPHAFSGGQRQRIAIARALAVEPRLLICDEPTSALDVSVQAQILNLLKGLQASRGLAYLFITHNLPVVGYLAHRVLVMYRGRIVEEGPAEALLHRPAHPYTRLLLASAPGQGMGRAVLEQDGAAAAPTAPGCPFAVRCAEVKAVCRSDYPQLATLEDGRRVACHLY